MRATSERHLTLGNSFRGAHRHRRFLRYTRSSSTASGLRCSTSHTSGQTLSPVRCLEPPRPCHPLGGWQGPRTTCRKMRRPSLGDSFPLGKMVGHVCLLGKLGHRVFPFHSAEFSLQLEGFVLSDHEFKEALGVGEILGCGCIVFHPDLTHRSARSLLRSLAGV